MYPPPPPQAVYWSLLDFRCPVLCPKIRSTMYRMLWRYHVDHVHVDIPHMKDYQDFGSAVRNQGTNHELISKYKVRPFLHAVIWHYFGRCQLSIEGAALGCFSIAINDVDENLSCTFYSLLSEDKNRDAYYIHNQMIYIY